MKKGLLLLIMMSGMLSLSAQIEMKDSTVQVIAYWNKGETQKYTVTTNKYKLKGNDTISKDVLKYDVLVTVIDSTANSLTLKWDYSNYSLVTDNPMLKRISSMFEDVDVVVKTNEMGVFQEVVNVAEIQTKIKQLCSKLSVEFKDVPNISAIVNQVEKTVASKEAIESAAIDEILQFLYFHGGKYTKDELYEIQTTLPNIYGGKPFDGMSTVQFDELNEAEDNVVIRMWQTVNEEQLLEATYKYVSDLAKAMKVDPPKKNDLKNLKNEMTIASRIHGSSGWIIYSLKTKEISLDGTTRIEETEMEITE